ncbi:MAG: hypothetical protein ACR2NM_05080 [Bythopirellula sp.]
MMTLRSLTARARAVLLLALGLASCAIASGQQLDPIEPLSEDSALICEAGAILGGGQADAAVRQVGPLAQQQERLILVALITRVDVNRNQQLDHHELQTLDYLTRQQLLQDVDTNRDRQLSNDELQQALAPPPNEPTGYATPELPRPAAPADATFRNLRRFGVGLPQPAPPGRNQPVSRAATFGNTAGFYTLPSSTRMRRSPQVVGFEVFRQSNGAYVPMPTVTMPTCR